VPVMAGVRQARGQGRGGEQGGGNEKLRFGHFDSPESPTEHVRFRAERTALGLKKVCQNKKIGAKSPIRSKLRVPCTSCPI
jgi:hypothetical protein